MQKFRTALLLIVLASVSSCQKANDMQTNQSSHYTPPTITAEKRKGLDDQINAISSSNLSQSEKDAKKREVYNKFFKSVRDSRKQ